MMAHRNIDLALCAALTSTAAQFLSHSQKRQVLNEGCPLAILTSKACQITPVSFYIPKVAQLLPRAQQCASAKQLVSKTTEDSVSSPRPDPSQHTQSWLRQFVLRYRTPTAELQLPKIAVGSPCRSSHSGATEDRDTY